MRTPFPLVLLVVALSGCVGWPLAEAPEPGGAEPVIEAEAPPEFVAADLVPRELAFRDLPAEILVRETWTKPLQEVEANLTGAVDARVAWFAGIEGGRTHLTVVNGHPFLTNESMPGPHRTGTGAPEAGHDHRERRPIDTGVVAAGGKPVGIPFPQAGRYVLEDEGGVRIVVLVHEDAPAGSPDSAFLTPGGRVTPAELEIRPGQRVLVWNQMDRDARLVETSYLVHLPQTTREVSFTPVDEGVHRLVAVVRRGADERGAAAARVLVDFERPATEREIGPYAGRLDPAPVGEPVEHAFTSELPLRVLNLRLRTHSPLPEPSDVRLVVLHEGEVLAELAAADGNLTLVDVPPGRVAMQLRPVRALAASYELSGAAEVRLPMPPALAEG